MVEQQALRLAGGGSIPTHTLHVKQLRVERCPASHAVAMNKLWHSRLPYCQRGPWIIAFRAHHENITYAVALWHNTSARNLPRNWLELRRMACSPSAPRNTGSWFLSVMARLIKLYLPNCDRLISYQDTEVHKGIIYQAAGWSIDKIVHARQRDRTKPRVGTNRAYRSNSNGSSPDSSKKIRWAITIK